VAPPAQPEVPAEERNDILHVLARFGGDRSAAARHLGISRTTLWRRVRQAEAEAPD